MPSKKDLAVVLERAKPLSIAMIRADREGAPGVVAKFLETMEDHLFDERVKVGTLMALADIHDKSLSIKFRNAIGCPPLRYLRCRQLEVAERLLREYGLEVGDVGVLVGMSDISVLGRLFRAWCGKTPKEVRFHEAPPEVEYHTHVRAFYGQLNDEEADRFADQFFRLYPRAARRFAGVPGEEPRRAEELWRQIRELPFAEQRARVRRHFFHTTALFDLLRRKSREEGRRDRRRGIALAELALASLDRCAESLTERGHDHQAQGLADLANARRLDLDFDGSAEEFRRAYAEWHTPRESPDELVLAEIYYLHSGLLEFQYQFQKASALEDQAIEIFESRNCVVGLAKTLIARAATMGYAGEPAAGIPDLKRALQLIDEKNEPYLKIVGYGNLALACIWSGKSAEARRELPAARKLCASLNDRMTECKLDWIQGLFYQSCDNPNGAHAFLKKSHVGFVELNEVLFSAIISLDRGYLYLLQGRKKKAVELASRALPMLDSLKIYREGITAFRILEKAVSAGRISEELISNIRQRLQKLWRDPMFRVDKD